MDGQQTLFDRLNPEPCVEFRLPDPPPFGGDTYEPEVDERRLCAQAVRVWTLMQDGEWRTLADIEAVTGDPQASISARLRDFRKRAFGGHDVFRRRRDHENPGGTWEYRLVPRPKGRV